MASQTCTSSRGPASEQVLLAITPVALAAISALSIVEAFTSASVLPAVVGCIGLYAARALHRAVS